MTSSDGDAAAGPTGPAAAGEAIPPRVRDRTHHRRWVDVLLVVWLTLIGAAIGVLCFFFLPWYLGSVPFPVSALVAGVACWFLPRMAYRLTGSMAMAAAPVLAWFVVTIVLFLMPNPTYALPLRIYLNQWRMLLLIGLGALAGAAALGLLWGEHLRARDADSDMDRDPGAMSPPDAGGTGRTGNTDRWGRGTPHPVAANTEPPRGEPS